MRDTLFTRVETNEYPSGLQIGAALIDSSYFSERVNLVLS